MHIAQDIAIPARSFFFVSFPPAAANCAIAPVGVAFEDCPPVLGINFGIEDHDIDVAAGSRT